MEGDRQPQADTADEDAVAGRRGVRAISLGPICWALILLPFLAGTAGVAAAVRDGRWNANPVDLAALLPLLAYLSLGVIVARHGRYAGRFVLATYSMAATLAACEFYLHVAVPRGLPQLPTRRVSHAPDTMPGIEGSIEFTVNRLGLRGADTSLDEADVRLLCVGGSTTACVYVTDECTWPWLLQQRLNGRLDRSVLVANAGRAGHIARHHDYLLQNYDLAPKFDWVLVLCGINDMGTLLRENYAIRRREVPLVTLTGMDRVRCPLYFRDTVLWQTLRSAVGFRLGEHIVQDETARWLPQLRQRRQAALRTHTLTGSPPNLQLALRRYREDLGHIIATCRRRGQRVTFMTQPTMYRPDLSEDLQHLLWQHCPKGAYTAGALAAMMDAFNQTLIEVCREARVDCVDLASRLPRDTTVFYDDCHFNVAGSERVARIVSEYSSQKLRGDRSLAHVRHGQ